MQLINSLFGNIDNAPENFFLTTRSPWGIKFFSTITWLGEWKLIIFFVVLTLALFWFKGKKNYILPFLITVGGSELFGQAAKIFFHRARPVGGLEAENDFSFPSGHALIAVAFYGFLIYYFWKNTKSTQARNIYLATGTLLILLIGLSRLYLGVHFFSDIIGGYILGLFWLAIGIYIHRENSKDSKAKLF